MQRVCLVVSILLHWRIAVAASALRRLSGEWRCRWHRRLCRIIPSGPFDEVQHSVARKSGWLFSLEHTEEIFRRCEAEGGKVLYISHVSESGEHDEFLQVSWPTSAKKALQKLRDKGCNEKFSVTVKISKEVVERWKQQFPEQIPPA